MQKFSLSQIVREELIRGFVFAISFFAFLTVGFVSIAYAADGGRFGAILNTILASGNWQTDTTGTVKNSAALEGKPASDFVQVPVGGFTCLGASQCIYRIDATGTPECR